MDSVVLQAAGPVLTAIGSIVLGIRLEAIIDAILIGIESNRNAIQKVSRGNGEDMALDLSHEKVRRELRKGKKILFWGFSALAIGGILNALSYFIN
ncbi:MAG: hypothetical protein JWO30_2848 [Fibrobacteres bacterium]|nr:hypothetical protein [Fibrobacterota bacterium]